MYAKYINAIFGEQFYRRYNFKISKELESAVSFENLFFTILLGQILYMEYPFAHLYGRTY